MATPLERKQTRAAAQPKRRAPTLDELRASRTVWATMPSGHDFLLRPPNMELHMLAGGLPASVRRLVTAGADDLNRMLASDDDNEATAAASDYFLYLVKLMVVEPDVSSLKTAAELDEALLPANFHFLIEIGQRERDTDALGRQLWGQPSLSRWESFRQFHGCGPDCPACTEMRGSYSVAAVL